MEELNNISWFWRLWTSVSYSRNLNCASASGTVLVDAGNFKMASTSLPTKWKYIIYNTESRFYLDFQLYNLKSNDIKDSLSLEDNN